MIIRKLTRVCINHRKSVLVAWIAILFAGFAMAPSVFGNLTSDAGEVRDSESARADAAIAKAAPSGDEFFAVVDGVDVDDPAVREDVTRTAAAVTALPGVAAVRTPWSGGDEPDRTAIAEDGKALALAVEFGPNVDDPPMDDATELVESIDAPNVLVGGGDLLDDEMDEQAASDLAKAEVISMPLVLILLVVVMGGLIAAGLPVLISIIGVATTFGALSLVSLVTDVSVYSINIVTMLGLGIAIDYALLVVYRFREERRTCPDVASALEETMATAGRTVAFSGLTVSASLAGLLVFPDAFLRSAGIAGMLVVLFVLAASLTLLPAIVAMVGHRVRPARPTSSDRGFFVAVTGAVSRRPIVISVTVAALLLIAAAPFLGARFAQPDGRSLPGSSPSRQLESIVESRFDEAAKADPITVVADRTIGPGDLDAYISTLRATEYVHAVAVRDGVPGLTVIDVVPEGDSQGETAQHLVDDLRGTDAPVPVRVTGDAAEIVDYRAALVERAPYALGIVVVATFVLLFLFTGSIVIPAKALVMNTLSLGASFGAIVWVFQDGNLGWLFGTDALGGLSLTTPALMLAIAFGLSMDYEVFLLGRIAEVWRRTGDNDRAIREGLQHTGRIVTAAAVLMAVVFAGFVAGGFSPVKQVGVGLMLAVLVDATLVRMLLMPAVMTLMGRANWWAPPFLRRLHDRIGLRESAGAPFVPTDTDSGSGPAGARGLAGSRG
ncbi:MMPL family transporter [Solicola gregarius]|uniref:MMPL family transporter n=1 Tax=Solicola gregarius TaxID=2908642 RepID=A0AA46TEQ9_9ACTN|nr:MMPL family transporter [Solicola gregarius]UYM03880.1 MMPL family transporter [Solicola gregarius]